MSTTSEKLTYLNETKSKIKDNINLTGVNITNEDTFRSYAGKLKQGLLDILNNGNDYLYNNFPQLNGEGQNISLMPTLEAPIKSELLGNTTQNGTPTPDAPVEVINTTGRQEVKVIGKNLTDNKAISGVQNGVTYTINQDKSITLNGTSTQAFIFDIDNGRTLEAGTYTLSLKGKILGCGIYLYVNNTLKTYVSSNWETDKVTFTLDSKTTFNEIRIDVQVNKTFNNITIYPMIEKGSTATTYEPYQSASYPINLPVENLFDIETNSLENRSSTRVGTTGYISLKAGTYTLNYLGADKSYYIYYDNNNTKIGESNWVNGTSTFTLANDYKLVFVFGKTGDTNINASDMSNVQIEKGTKANSYTPYGTTPIELCKIGDYQDSIRKGTGKNLFDGTYYTKKYINYRSGLMLDSDDWSASDYIEIKPNTNYTLSGITNSGQVAGTSFYDSSKTFISSVYSTVYSFSTPANAKYLRFSINNETPTNIMLNEGSTATDYEPYGSRGKWLLTKKIGKVVLDGSDDEGWQMTSSQELTNTIYLSSIAIDGLMKENTLTFSNYFTKQSGLWSNDVEGYQLTTQTGNIRLRINKSTASYVSTFKTWLSTHNTEIYYVLATPTVEEITDSTLLNDLNNLEDAKSYNGTTNIIITAETPADIKITALKNE